MKILQFSEKLQTQARAKGKPVEGDPIHMFTQFFIPSTAERLTEIQFCLRANLLNPAVTVVHLLNERTYTPVEMGTSELSVEHQAKLCQSVLGRRLTFRDVFAYARANITRGFLVLANSDIFVDRTIERLWTSTLATRQSALALLRFEYAGARAVGAVDLEQTRTAKLFGPRFDSQDTWIFHSNFTVAEKDEAVFDFAFGRPGCDNKIVYLLTVLGYVVVNDPTAIRTYHVHANETRQAYTAEGGVLPVPFGLLVPFGYPADKMAPSMGVNLVELAPRTKQFSEIRFEDNLLLHDYIAKKLGRDQRFIVPRIAGIENNFAVFGRICKETGRVDPNIGSYFNRTQAAMKNNAGIHITSMDSITRYSDMYMRALDNAEMIGGWELWGTYYPHIRESYDIVRQRYKKQTFFWTFAFDIFHYVRGCGNPWTHALRGKRILIVSAFAATIQTQLPHLTEVYGIDLFPGCTLTTIRPPQTQGAEPSREFSEELEEFCGRLDAIKDTYDVALVSCGGYGNLVCNHIYEKNHKSAIYVGGVLQMYFGILGERWVRERPEVVALFQRGNAAWTRPSEAEKPANFGAVEGACYW